MSAIMTAMYLCKQFKTFLFYFSFFLFCVSDIVISYSCAGKMSIWHPAESRRVCLHFFLRHATVRDGVCDTQRSGSRKRERRQASFQKTGLK